MNYLIFIFHLLTDIKEDHHAMQENALHADQACIGATVVPGHSAAQIKGCISFESGHATKLEEAHQCGHPMSDTEQEFGSDSLSIAQSKLLEDWRPEPLHLQSCQSDSFVSSGSSALGKFWCKTDTLCYCLRLLLNSNGIVFAMLIRKFHTNGS